MHRTGCIHFGSQGTSPYFVSYDAVCDTASALLAAFAVTAHELVYAAGGIYQLRLAGVEGV